MDLGQAKDDLVKIVEQNAMWTVDADKPVLYKLTQSEQEIKAKCCQYGLPSDGYIDLYHKKLDELNNLKVVQ